MRNDLTIALWQPPAEDHAAWQALTSETLDRRTYMDMLAAIQADQQRLGRTVRRVRMSVAIMRAEIARRGLTNTPDHRAAVVATYQSEP